MIEMRKKKYNQLMENANETCLMTINFVSRKYKKNSYFYFIPNSLLLVTLTSMFSPFLMSLVITINK